MRAITEIASSIRASASTTLLVKTWFLCCLPFLLTGCSQGGSNYTPPPAETISEISLEIFDLSRDGSPTDTYVLDPSFYPEFLTLLSRSKALKTPMKWEVLGSITLKNSSNEIILPLYLSRGDFIFKTKGVYYQGSSLEKLRGVVTLKPAKS